ncbi:MAG TPA: hypothetical protein VEN12_07670 [Verrucomicrobiae bacterium]|nr:hypothetical protein [Verrucomicrobiae bacterium]
MRSTTNTVRAPAQPARRFDRGRGLRLVFGSLGVLAALAFLAGGGALTWALQTHRDGSGYFTTHTHHYQTSSYALSTESLDVSGMTGALEDRLGRLRITATSTAAAKPVFIGIARAENVDRYLARVEHDELRDIDSEPSGIEYRRLGAGAPQALPATRSIWRAYATGTGTQTVTWPVEKGHWSAVAMNADGSRTVSLDAQLAARVSHVWWIATGLFVIGGLSLAGGGALVYSGTRRRASVTARASVAN